jgi:O-antigen/teichoic acid export membrane protein
MSGPFPTQTSAAEATTGASVMRGGAWNFMSRALPQVYVLIVSIVAARFLGPNGMGRQSFISFVSLAVITLFSGGLSVSLMRYVGESFGREREGEAAALIAWGWRLTTAGAAAGAGLLVAVALAGASPEAAWIFAAVATGFAILHTVPSAALIGTQRWREATIVGLITGTLAVPAMIVVLSTGGGVTGMFVVEAVAAAANLVFTAVLARRAYARLERRPAGDTLRSRTAGYALVSTVGVVLTLIVFRRSEFFFLNQFSSDSEIAIYSIAFAAIYAVSLLPEGLAAALYPAFATLYGAGAGERLRSGFTRAIRLLVLVSIPVAAAVFALGPDALVLVYGEEYSGTGPVLQLMVVCLPLLPLMNVSNALLVGMGLPKPMLVSAAGAAVVNVALALALIPRYDAVGAAIANTCAQAIVAIALLAYASRLVGDMALDVSSLLRALAAAAPGGLVAWLVVNALPPVPGLMLGLLAGALVFTVLARLLGVLRADDAEWLRRHTRGGRLGRAVEAGTAFFARQPSARGLDS